MKPDRCIVHHCNRPIAAKNLCASHYSRLHRYGSATPLHLKPIPALKCAHKRDKESDALEPVADAPGANLSLIPDNWEEWDRMRILSDFEEWEKRWF